MADLKKCPFCDDKMKVCRSIMTQPALDGVQHQLRNNNCPVGVGVYKLEVWNNQPDTKVDSHSASHNNERDVNALFNKWAEDKVVAMVMDNSKLVVVKQAFVAGYNASTPVS